MITSTVRALGCEVWGVEYRPRPAPLLRVFIDRADGVTIDDCERVSNQLSALLDVEDPITDSYRLEVSSPGLDRVLFHREQYLACVGERVDVRLAFPHAGRRRFEGMLVRVVGEDVVVRPDADRSNLDAEEADEYVLPLQQIQRTRIVPDAALRNPAQVG